MAAIRQTTWVLFTSLVLVLCQPEAVCPRGFTQFGGHCYIFKMYKVGWYQARVECERQQAYLASVNTQAEQDFLVTQIQNNYTTSGDDYYWIGLRMAPLSEDVVWDDGTDVAYSSWSGVEPNCLNVGCVGAISEYSNYHWQDINSSFREFFICEREIPT